MYHARDICQPNREIWIVRSHLHSIHKLAAFSPVTIDDYLLSQRLLTNTLWKSITQLLLRRPPSLLRIAQPMSWLPCTRRIIKLREYLQATVESKVQWRAIQVVVMYVSERGKTHRQFTQHFHWLTGVAAARLPTPKMRNCWINAPPLLPSGLPTTSTAALPLVFDSWSNGMYAISLHGSKSEYFALFERIFWAAPTITASMSGVVPSDAAIGAKNGANMVSA